MTVTVDKANQTALTVSSTNGTYGTNLTLATGGGSTAGSVTWSVSDNTAAGCAITSGALRSTSAGTCTVTATMAGSDNYNEVSSLATTVTLAVRPITVTVTAGQTKVYGQTDPSFAYTITSGDLVNSNTLSGALARAGGASVGTYAINQGTLANSNYGVTFVPANFAITAKPITVTADVKTKVYGETDPALTYSITTGGPLVGSDAFSGALSRTGTDAVGTYTITQGSLALSSNYTLTYQSANFTITAKPITVTATAGQTKVYGESDPTFAYTVTSGSLETGDSLSGALARAGGASVGAYAINQGT
ncbi:MAG: MBG domain-containing protein, partial [Actinomycetota bacterium]